MANCNANGVGLDNQKKMSNQSVKLYSEPSLMDHLLKKTGPKCDLILLIGKGSNWPSCVPED